MFFLLGMSLHAECFNVLMCAEVGNENCCHWNGRLEFESCKSSGRSF